MYHKKSKLWMGRKTWGTWDSPTGKGEQMGNAVMVGNVKFDIKKDAEYNEYCVRVIVNGLRNEKRSYYTDDKQDAIDTLNEMVKEERGNNGKKAT